MIDGTLIEEARHLAGYAGHGGRAKFARRLGVEPRTVYRWETGQHQPSTDALFKISDATGLPIAWFLREKAVA